jgi:hypothetical protein
MSLDHEILGFLQYEPSWGYDLKAEFGRAISVHESRDSQFDQAGRRCRDRERGACVISLRGGRMGRVTVIDDLRIVFSTEFFI